MNLPNSELNLPITRDSISNPPLQQIRTALDLDALVADWLGIDTANGDAQLDTVKTYRTNFEQFSGWCLDFLKKQPMSVDELDIKAYRQFLLECGAQHQTISLKLTTVRRFFDAAVARGYLTVNPGKNVKPPRKRQAETKVKYLTIGEAELLLRVAPKETVLTKFRDQAMIALMLLEGLRRCEVQRMNNDAIETLPDGTLRIFVRGKGRDGYIYPRDDSMGAVKDYLELLGETEPDSDGIPIFVNIRKGGQQKKTRLTRAGINFIINDYLQRAGVKREGASCHQLRHTCGALIYLITKDLRAVQETLRHSTLEMASVYAQIINRGSNRFTREIPLTLQSE